MPSSEHKTLRFAVGSPVEYRSAIWRLWVKDKDVYLAARSIGGMLKLSLHRSGIWRLAWTQQSGIHVEGSSDRVEKRWRRPVEFGKGWTQGPAVIVPNTAIERPFRRNLTEDAPIVWTPTPAPGTQHHFTILFADADVADSWQTVLRPTDTLVGTLDMGASRKVLLARRTRAMLEKERSYVERFVADMQIRYSSAVPEVHEASVFTADTDDGGHPYLLDMPLGWENE